MVNCQLESVVGQIQAAQRRLKQLSELVTVAVDLEVPVQVHNLRGLWFKLLLKGHSERYSLAKFSARLVVRLTIMHIHCN